MQLSKGGKSPGKDKIIAIVAIVLILGVAIFFIRTFMAGSNTGTATANNVPTPVVSGSDEFGTMPDGSPSTPASGTASAPATQPASSQPASAPAPAPSTQSSSSGQVVKTSEIKMRQIKVFGSINISYPDNWRIRPGSGNISAEFTNGVASLELFPPDPNSRTAQQIAESVRKQYLTGSAITGQGACKVANQDAYWISVRYKGNAKRIVGINASTMIGAVESVNGGQITTYRAVFDKIENGMTFNP